jgi:thiamine pyrophosphate-dependent acetolactate synthase large subunit-like protein
LSVATTFHGKGVFPDDHPQALGAVGFMATTTSTSASTART